MLGARVTVLRLFFCSASEATGALASFPWLAQIKTELHHTTTRSEHSPGTKSCFRCRPLCTAHLAHDPRRVLQRVHDVGVVQLHAHRRLQLLLNHVLLRGRDLVLDHLRVRDRVKGYGRIHSSCAVRQCAGGRWIWNILKCACRPLACEHGLSYVQSNRRRESRARTDDTFVKRHLCNARIALQVNGDSHQRCIGAEQQRLALTATSISQSKDFCHTPKYTLPKLRTGSNASVSGLSCQVRSDGGTQRLFCTQHRSSELLQLLSSWCCCMTTIDTEV